MFDRLFVSRHDENAGVVLGKSWVPSGVISSMAVENPLWMGVLSGKSPISMVHFPASHVWFPEGISMNIPISSNYIPVLSTIIHYEPPFSNRKATDETGWNCWGRCLYPDRLSNGGAGSEAGENLAALGRGWLGGVAGHWRREDIPIYPRKTLGKPWENHRKMLV